MLKPENQVDKRRFEKIKDRELAAGQDETSAIDDAAAEVKEVRESEGRSKEDGSTSQRP